MVFLIQRYPWQGQERTSINLFSATTGLNSLLCIHHQIDSKLLGMSLSTKDTVKALTNLKDFNIKIKPRLLSDSQTCLSLCCKPATQLTLGPGLIVSRLQELFGHDHLHFAPGALFATSVDLLTCYNLKLLSLITENYYSPSFLNPWLADRAIPRVSERVDTGKGALHQKQT